MLADCFTRVGVPKGLQDYISARKDLFVKQGLDENAASHKAIDELKSQSIETLADIHRQIGNDKFVQKKEENITTENESTKPSIILPEEVKKIQGNEVVPIKKEGEPPVPPEIDSDNIESTNDGIGITHADTKEIRIENNLPEYEKTPQTVEQWNIEADKRIKNGELPALIKKMQNGEPITDIEQVMMGKNIALLDEAVKNNPSNENISALKRAIQLSDEVGGSAWGRSGRARQETFLPDDSLGRALINEMESLGVNELPEKAKAQIISEHEELAKLRDELAKSQAENEKLQNAAAAKTELDKTRKSASKTKKTHEDFIKERTVFKDELKSAKDKHDKWLKDNGIQRHGGGFTLTTDMAKAIGKIIKSHAEETILKLDDLVSKVYEEVKDVLEGISKKDIVDVMAGVYNEKKATRNELAANLRDLKTEAQLLKKLSDVRLGKEPSSTREQTNKSARVKEIQDKINEIRKRRKDENPIEENDEGKLKAKQRSIEKKIEEIQNDIKDGRFEKETLRHPVLLDKKTQALQDRLIKLETQQAIRRAKNDYEKMSWFRKAADTFWQVTGLRRLINAAIDFSLPFRQGNTVTMNPFKIKTTVKSFANMFNLAFSPDRFKRFQYNLEKSDLGRMFIHFGGVFSNPSEVKMERREEEFSNSLLSRLHQKIEGGNNEKLKKVANVADKVWFSERAAAGFINTLRIEEFTNKAKSLRAQGLTPENSPQAYKDATKWVMNMSGRGNLLKALEDSHAGRIAANRSYFGARLMAAKINMLNPVTYAKLAPEVRVQAIKDMVGYTSGLAITGLAVLAAGGTISFNPDDPDFLQARFGDKVYDLTGGSVAYVRTFLRFTKAVGYQLQESKEANSYSRFAASSIFKSLVANKLSPNTAYLYHFFTGKSSTYGDNGKLQDFDPLEIVKIYPLYVDGTIQAFKKGGLSDALAMLIPDLFGIGAQQYEKTGGSTGGGGGGYNRSSKNQQKSTVTIHSN